MNQGSGDKMGKESNQMDIFLQQLYVYSLFSPFFKSLDIEEMFTKIVGHYIYLIATVNFAN